MKIHCLRAVAALTTGVIVGCHAQKLVREIAATLRTSEATRPDHLPDNVTTQKPAMPVTKPPLAGRRANHRLPTQVATRCF
jgi:hypothetical protein